MDRTILLHSLSSTSKALCSRTFSRSYQRLARLSSKRHRLIPTAHRRSLLRNYLRLVTTASPLSLHLQRQFSPHTPKAIATSSAQSSPDVVGVHDDVMAQKLGFEKVSEQFIEECKSTAVLFRHKKTGAEVMSVCNDDENKVFGVVFRTPPCCFQ